MQGTTAGGGYVQIRPALAVEFCIRLAFCTKWLELARTGSSRTIVNEICRHWYSGVTNPWMLRLKPSRFTCSTPRLKKRRCGLCPSFFLTKWRKRCTAMMKLFSKKCFSGTRWTQRNTGCIVASMPIGWRIILLQLKASSWTNLSPSVCMGMKFKVFATPKEEWFRPWLGAVIFRRACRHCPDTWPYVCFLTTTAHPGPSLTFGLFWLLGLRKCVTQALAMLGLHISSRIRQLKATSSGS